MDKPFISALRANALRHGIKEFDEAADYINELEAKVERLRREKGDAIDHSLSLQRQVNELEAENAKQRELMQAVALADVDARNGENVDVFNSAIDAMADHLGDI